MKFTYRDIELMTQYPDKILLSFSKKIWVKYCISYLCTPNSKREFSSAGSEHLPYKQRVGGSNPSTPTDKRSLMAAFYHFIPYNNAALSGLEAAAI